MQRARFCVGASRPERCAGKLMLTHPSVPTAVRQVGQQVEIRRHGRRVGSKAMSPPPGHH